VIVALAGGVGGAKLAHGLARTLPAEELLIAVNTGDDFDHLGFAISPDVDTVMYTLAGLADPERGWGRGQESWHFLQALEALGGETWFALGDRDLAVHVERTQRLRAGATLEEVTAHLCRRLGVQHGVAPMSNQPVRTVLETDRGTLGFQDYFVRRRCEPCIKGIRYDGAAGAAPSRAFEAALAHSDLEAIVICPSNPYLSIGPILAIPRVRTWFSQREVPVVAVSPIIGGAAVKGPAAKNMAELGAQVSVLGLSDHYGPQVDAWVIDHADAGQQRALEQRGKRTLVTATLMTSDAQRGELARATLQFARSFGSRFAR
jgi:LPPG:FO 2-phospho-L-lactate transferase